MLYVHGGELLRELMLNDFSSPMATIGAILP